jgi:hypothetical protein
MPNRLWEQLNRTRSSYIAPAKSTLGTQGPRFRQKADPGG